MHNYTLAATGSLSLEAALERSAAANKQEVARYRRREESIEESKKVWAGLIATIGAAAVLSNILGSTEMSPEQQKDEIRVVNDILRNSCIYRGGYFLGAGDYTLGSCSVL